LVKKNSKPRFLQPLSTALRHGHQLKSPPKQVPCT